jgi:hypothetical protein
VNEKDYLCKKIEIMSRVVLDLHSEKDVLLLLALAERLSATIVEITPILDVLNGTRQSPLFQGGTVVGNYNKTTFLYAIHRAQQKKVFQNISNAVQWQQTLRKEDAVK